MADDGKFGTFAGVFTPSVLTILGVIMYLRLPWMVGQAGLVVALGIVLAAHVVSVATGLSISSIATDKKVGAGGPYYIISRSFGLPIGGAIGMALFLGLSFSVSLYIVGFSTSLLSALEVEASATAIRVCGSLTLVGITIITFISTSFAIKTQYVILVLVGGSLVAVFFGHTSSAAPHLSAAASSPSFGVLFGIFFPAVTGFTAGVNMSGDLRDPKGAIPKGTMLAIGVGFAIYAGLVVYLALSADPAALRDDPEVLQHHALWSPAVIAGIWGATLSSALGSIMGAPRILQAMSADQITPRAFAKGYGPTREPRRALLIAFAIAEAGILIAELDLIARVVSMVFLALYAAINVTCAIESWASPDFRPRFRIPKVVSIIGAVSAVLLMIQLDILAMLGATVMMVGLFLFLSRRQLSLESGDTWEGVWASLVRAGLHRIHQRATNARNWRPNVLLFDDADHPRHAAIRQFAMTLASGNGMVTDFALAPPAIVGGAVVEADAAPASAPASHVGVFDARLVTDDPLAAVAITCQHHGFSGLPPNALLVPWRYHAGDPDAFVHTLTAAAERGLNLLLFEEPREVRRANLQIDVWWARDAGNLALSVALVRFITRSEGWERASINVLIVGDGGDGDAVLRAKAVRYLDANRVEATVRVVARAAQESVHGLVCNQSRGADLVLLGLPTALATLDLDSLERVAALPGGVVFLHASKFADVLVAPTAARATRTSGAIVAQGGPPPLALPADPELAATVTAVATHTSALVTKVHSRVVGAGQLYLDLCATVQGLVERRAAQLTAAAREPDLGARRGLLRAATSEFLVAASGELATLTADGVVGQATLLDELLADVGRPDAGLPAGVAGVARIERPRAALASADGDSVSLRTWKRQRRWRYFYRRAIPDAVAVRALVQHGHEQVVRAELVRVLERFRAASHELVTEVGRILATSEWRAHARLARAEVDDVDDVVALIEQARASGCQRLEALAARLREGAADDDVALDAAAATAARALAASLDRVDATVAAATAARELRRRGELEPLAAAATTWREQQLALLGRIRLAVQLARFRDRLTGASTQALVEAVAAARGSGRRTLEELRTGLARRAADPDAAAPELRDEVPYDAGPPVARLTQLAAVLCGELPETETVITDDAAAALIRGGGNDETVMVPVRAAVQAIVEAEVLAPLATNLAQLAEADGRAWSVARETVMLVAARPRDSEGDDADLRDSFDPAARIEVQLGKLADGEAACGDDVVAGLQAIASATTVDGLASALVERGGRRSSTKSPSRLLGLARRVGAGVRAAAANLVYRRSAGVVYAAEARQARRKTPEQAVRELTGRSVIAPVVASSLPGYYRDLFIGQVNINEAFFVGRDVEVRTGVEVVTGGRPGLRTAMVTGSRGAGKTTLCQRIASASQSDVFWIAAPPGGAATREALARAVEQALGRRGKPGALLARLPRPTVVVVDDLDLWWERRPGGLEAIDGLLELIGEIGDRVGFVLACSDGALRVLQDLRPLARLVHAQLACQALPGRVLEQVIMARHGSTGLGLKLAGRDALGAWTRARLFDAHFDHARGNVGFALRAWVTHLDRVVDDQLTIRFPRPLDWDALDDLRPEYVALLIELVLHKAATADKLVRLTGRPAAAVADGLAELTAIGLVVQNRRRVAQLNPYVQVPVLDWLDRRGLA